MKALILADTAESKALVNERMAYVSIGRGAEEVKDLYGLADALGEKAISAEIEDAGFGVWGVPGETRHGLVCVLVGRLIKTQRNNPST